MSVRLVKVSIGLVFSEVGSNSEMFLKEFHKIDEGSEDPIAQWLKIARAKGDTQDTDPVLLNLIVELHKKIDAIEKLLKNEEPKRLSLAGKAEIESIGFEHFKLSEDVLQEGVEYYGRVTMPTHPRRDLALFFTAVDNSLAKITKIHKRDEDEWCIYLTARERALIREAKESKE